MRTRRLVAIVFPVALAASSLLAQAPVPRRSPELAMTKPSGEQMMLSSLKGKVVVMEVMFVNSPHCISLAEMLNGLQGELGLRGFQAVAVAFGPHSDPALVGHIAEHLKLSYPFGSATSTDVDSFLGRTGNEMLKIPQIVVIDRKGVIRATSASRGDPSLEDEATLRAFVDSLLNEKVAAARATPATKKDGQL
jgi:peroxiredoxin